MRKEKCKDCMYMQKYSYPVTDEFDDERDDLGECLRFPPIYVGLHEKATDEFDPTSGPGYWRGPPVYDFQWCGEFKPKA